MFTEENGVSCFSFVLTDGEDWPCPYCTKAFHSNINLNDHLYTTHGIGQRDSESCPHPHPLLGRLLTRSTHLPDLPILDPPPFDPQRS